MSIPCTACPCSAQMIDCVPAPTTDVGDRQLPLGVTARQGEPRQLLENDRKAFPRRLAEALVAIVVVELLVRAMIPWARLRRAGFTFARFWHRP